MILRMKMAKNCTRCLLEEEFKGLGIGMMIYFDETVDLPSLNRRELDIVNFVHFTKKCLFDMGGQIVQSAQSHICDSYMYRMVL